jgi:hypothetical protein
MTSTRSPLFTASSRDLAPWAAELNSFLTLLRAQLSSDVLEIRPSRTGLGVFVRRGRSVRAGTRLVAFWGELTLNPHPRSHYVFELPRTRFRSRRVRLYVDARLACLRGDPPPDQAAMLNHCCRTSDPTIRAVWARHPSSTLPIMVGEARHFLRGGTELTYDYDAGFTFGPFTFNRLEAALAHTLNPPPQPCRCAGLAPCPRDRFLP